MWKTTYFSTGRNFDIFWKSVKNLIWHAQTLGLQVLFLTVFLFMAVDAFCVELQHLQIQGCHFLKSVLNLDLTLSDDGKCPTFFDSPRNYWFRCILRRVMVIFRQQKNFGPNVRYCVFGYHFGLSSWSSKKWKSDKNKRSEIKEWLNPNHKIQSNCS